MATALVYPVADGATTDWTPSTGTVHWSLLDETYPPGNTSDYIRVTGFSAGKVERLVLGNLTPGTASQVYSIVVKLNMKSTNAGNSPALRARLYLTRPAQAETVIGFQEFACDTSGAWEEVQMTFGPYRYQGPDYESATIEIELTPINGDIGYSPSI